MHSRNHTADQLREEARKYEDMARRCRELADMLEQGSLANILEGDSSVNVSGLQSGSIELTDKSETARSLSDASQTALNKRHAAQFGVTEKASSERDAFFTPSQQSSAGQADAALTLERDSRARTKKEQIYHDLLQNGPATAKELQEKFGYGLATVYAILQDSKLFRKKQFYFHAISRRRSSLDNLYASSDEYSSSSQRRRAGSQHEKTDDR